MANETKAPIGTIALVGAIVIALIGFWQLDGKVAACSAEFPGPDCASLFYMQQALLWGAILLGLSIACWRWASRDMKNNAR